MYWLTYFLPWSTEDDKKGEFLQDNLNRLLNDPDNEKSRHII